MDDIQKLIQELRQTKEYNQLMSEEAKEGIFDFSKELMKQIQELTNGYKQIEQTLASSYAVFEQNVKKAEGYLKGYENEVKEFNKLSETNKESAKNFWESLINRIESDPDGDKDLAKEFRKSMNDVIDQMSKLSLSKDKEKIEELERRKVNYEKMMARISSSKRSELGKAFSSMKIDFQLDPSNMNPYAGIFKLWQTDRESAIASMKEFSKIVWDIYDNHLNPSNLVFTFFSNFKKQTVDAIKSIDTIQASFMKATGLGEKYNSMIVEGWRDNLAFNISLEDMVKSYESLIDSVKGFTLFSKQNQESMANYTALLSRLGVGTDLTSKVMSYFSDTLGHNAEQAKYATGAILGLSEVTGDTLKTIMSSFIEALPILSKFSGQTTRVFKELYATAKSLKMEVASLLQITENFDSYETAATNVGRLNAILGGPYLNTIKLMQMEEGERIQTLNQAFAATGKNWKALNKYERQAIASAAGITKLDDAEKLFSGSLSDVNKLMRDRTITQAELEKRNQAAATLTEKLASIMSSLAIAAKPILDVISSVLSGVQFLVEKFSGFGVLFSYVFLGIGWKVVKFIKNSLSNAFVEVGKKILGVQKPLESAKDAMSDVGTSAIKTSTSLGTSVATLGTALSTAAVPIAKAILLIGGAIAIVIALFYSFKEIGKGIASIFQGVGDVLSGFGDVLSGIGSTLEAAADSMQTYGFQLRTNVLIGFLDKISSMSTNPIEKINELTNSITNLGNSLYKIPGNELSKFANFFEEISDLSESTANRASATFMNSLSDFMKVTATITPEKITNVEKITKNISEMSNEISKNKNIEGVLDKLVKLINPTEGKGKGGGTIEIYINEELKYKKNDANISVYGNSKMRTN